MSEPTGREVRQGLPHPVVDVDGHIVESLVVVMEYMEKVAGTEVTDRFRTAAASFATRQRGILATADAKGSPGTFIAPWWTITANPIDRATAFFPNLLHERMDELGLDFSVLYTSVGLVCFSHPDDAIRRGSTRAINTYLADLCDGFGDRLAPAAVIPTHTPKEAVAEIEHAVEVLGFKAVVLNDYVVRHKQGGGEWYDLLALDSPWDYDPVFQSCVDHRVALTVHSPTMGLPLRQSPTRYSANHIGTFAASSDAFAKALIYGGVMTRFPTLQVAFLEGGVSWGVQLAFDLASRLEKRGRGRIENLDPTRIDWSEWEALVDRYGGTRFEGEQLRRSLLAQSDNPPVETDDFRDAGIVKVEQFAAIFDRLFFGCEADEPTIGFALAAARLDGFAPLRCVLGSDIGHWDVADMTHVVTEAYELLEDGELDDERFRSFVCDDPIRLHGRLNPSFFEGTPVASYASALLASVRSSDTRI